MNYNPNTATHLCETCKKYVGCDTCIDIDSGHFDEVLMERISDFDKDGNNPTLTTIVVECKGYEKEGA